MQVKNKKDLVVENKTITIVGGGTAGLVTALILATRLNNKIKVIKSDKIGIVGVGEGSTEHWEDFMNVCDIDVFELIKETDATVKLGIYFKDWTEKPYFHNVTSFNQTKIGQFPAGLALNYVEGKEQIYCKYMIITTTVYYSAANGVTNPKFWTHLFFHLYVFVI